MGGEIYEAQQISRLALILTFVLALVTAAPGETTIVHDRAGRTIAKTRTDANGNTVIYDKSNRVIGTVVSR